MERRIRIAINDDVIALDDSIDDSAALRERHSFYEIDAEALRVLRDYGAYDAKELDAGFCITIRGSANTRVQPLEATRDGITLAWELQVPPPETFLRAFEIGINPLSINPHSARREIFIPSPRPLDPKRERVVYLPNDDNPTFMLIVCPWEPEQRRAIGAIGGTQE